MNNLEMLEELNKKVFGHLEAKKALIALITRSRIRHFQKYIKGMDTDFLLSPHKILLIGASGSGKTHLVESLQQINPFPLVRIDATHLNPAGSGSGGIRPKELKEMVVEQASLCCDLYPEKYFTLEGAVDRTVVFIDEVDKLGVEFESSGNWNRHVQSNFLTIIDNKNEFSGLSFVFAGAFSGITKEQKTKHLGFGEYKAEDNTKMLDNEVVKAGLIPEFVGRITQIIELDRFTRDTYRQIIQDKLLPKKRLDLAAYGVFDAPISDEELESILDKVMKSEQGVRYLHRALDKHFLSTEFDAGTEHCIYNEY